MSPRWCAVPASASGLPRMAGLPAAARRRNLPNCGRVRRSSLAPSSASGISRCSEFFMVQSEIAAVRALLTGKPRPVGWAQRRERIDEVGSVWPVADDVKLSPADADSVPGEWSIVPGSDLSRVLMFFHGGGYCSGSARSHRRMVTEAGRAAKIRTLSIEYRLA